MQLPPLFYPQLVSFESVLVDIMAAQGVSSGRRLRPDFAMLEQLRRAMKSHLVNLQPNSVSIRQCIASIERYRAASGLLAGVVPHLVDPLLVWDAGSGVDFENMALHFNLAGLAAAAAVSSGDAARVAIACTRAAGHALTAYEAAERCAALPDCAELHVLESLSNFFTSLPCQHEQRLLAVGALAAAPASWAQFARYLMTTLPPGPSPSPLTPLPPPPPASLACVLSVTSSEPGLLSPTRAPAAAPPATALPFALVLPSSLSMISQQYFSILRDHTDRVSRLVTDAGLVAGTARPATLALTPARGRVYVDAGLALGLQGCLQASQVLQNARAVNTSHYPDLMTSLEVVRSSVNSVYRGQLTLASLNVASTLTDELLRIHKSSASHSQQVVQQQAQAAAMQAASTVSSVLLTAEQAAAAAAASAAHVAALAAALPAVVSKPAHLITTLAHNLVHTLVNDAGAAAVVGRSLGEFDADFADELLASGFKWPPHSVLQTSPQLLESLALRAACDHTRPSSRTALTVAAGYVAAGGALPASAVTTLSTAAVSALTVPLCTHDAALILAHVPCPSHHNNLYSSALRVTDTPTTDDINTNLTNAVANTAAAAAPASAPPAALTACLLSGCLRAVPGNLPAARAGVRLATVLSNHGAGDLGAAAGPARRLLHTVVRTLGGVREAGDVVAEAAACLARLGAPLPTPLQYTPQPSTRHSEVDGNDEDDNEEGEPTSQTDDALTVVSGMLRQADLASAPVAGPFYNAHLQVQEQAEAEAEQPPEVVEVEDMLQEGGHQEMAQAVAEAEAAATQLEIEREMERIMNMSRENDEMMKIVPSAQLVMTAYIDDFSMSSPSPMLVRTPAPAPAPVAPPPPAPVAPPPPANPPAPVTAQEPAEAPETMQQTTETPVAAQETVEVPVESHNPVEAPVSAQETAEVLVESQEPVLAPVASLMAPIVLHESQNIPVDMPLNVVSRSADSLLDSHHLHQTTTFTPRALSAPASCEVSEDFSDSDVGAAVAVAFDLEIECDPGHTGDDVANTLTPLAAGHAFAITMGTRTVVVGLVDAGSRLDLDGVSDHTTTSGANNDTSTDCLFHHPVPACAEMGTPVVASELVPEPFAESPPLGSSLDTTRPDTARTSTVFIHTRDLLARAAAAAPVSTTTSELISSGVSDSERDSSWGLVDSSETTDRPPLRFETPQPQAKPQAKQPVAEAEADPLDNDEWPSDLVFDYDPSSPTRCTVESPTQFNHDHDAPPETSDVPELPESDWSEVVIDASVLYHSGMVTGATVEITDLITTVGGGIELQTALSSAVLSAEQEIAIADGLDQPQPPTPEQPHPPRSESPLVRNTHDRLCRECAEHVHTRSNGDLVLDIDALLPQPAYQPPATPPQREVALLSEDEHLFSDDDLADSHSHDHHERGVDAAAEADIDHTSILETSDAWVEDPMIVLSLTDRLRTGSNPTTPRRLSIVHGQSATVVQAAAPSPQLPLALVQEELEQEQQVAATLVTSPAPPLPPTTTTTMTDLSVSSVIQINITPATPPLARSSVQIVDIAPTLPPTPTPSPSPDLVFVQPIYVQATRADAESASDIESDFFGSGASDLLAAHQRDLSASDLAQELFVEGDAPLPTPQISAPAAPPTLQQIAQGLSPAAIPPAPAPDTPATLAQLSEVDLELLQSSSVIESSPMLARSRISPPRSTGPGRPSPVMAPLSPYGNTLTSPYNPVRTSRLQPPSFIASARTLANLRAAPPTAAAAAAALAGPAGRRLTADISAALQASVPPRALLTDLGLLALASTVVGAEPGLMKAGAAASAADAIWRYLAATQGATRDDIRWSGVLGPSLAVLNNLASDENVALALTQPIAQTGNSPVQAVIELLMLPDRLRARVSAKACAVLRAITYYPAAALAAGPGVAAAAAAEALVAVRKPARLHVALEVLANLVTLNDGMRSIVAPDSFFDLLLAREVYLSAEEVYQRAVRIAKGVEEAEPLFDEIFSILLSSNDPEIKALIAQGQQRAERELSAAI